MYRRVYTVPICMYILRDKALYVAFIVCAKIVAKVMCTTIIQTFFLSIEGAPICGLSAAGTEGQRHK